MAKVITLGELMLRLSTPNHERIIQADSFDVCYGGGEANVAVTLANFGAEVEFVTKLPDNPPGDAALAELRKYNVGTHFIARGGERLGIYYLESGSSVRPSKVIYDRAHSAIAEAVPEDFDFEAVFSGADWFHFTGITPAISERGTELVRAALKAAKAAGVTVSCDLNFRKKLWTSEKAREVMTDLMQYVDICIGNEEDADKVLGFRPAGSDVEKGKLDLAGYKDIFSQMCDRFHFRYVVSSLRESRSASDNGWSACVMDGRTGEFYHSSHYNITPIVDRVGGGDAVAGGFIYGLLYPDETKRIVGAGAVSEADNADGGDFGAGNAVMRNALEFAVAGAALKHTIPGDFNHISKEEAGTLLKSGGSGRVQR